MCLKHMDTFCKNCIQKNEGLTEYSKKKYLKPQLFITHCKNNSNKG